MRTRERNRAAGRGKTVAGREKTELEGGPRAVAAAITMANVKLKLIEASVRLLFYQRKKNKVC